MLQLVAFMGDRFPHLALWPLDLRKCESELVKKKNICVVCEDESWEAIVASYSNTMKALGPHAETERIERKRKEKENRGNE